MADQKQRELGQRDSAEKVLEGIDVKGKVYLALFRLISPIVSLNSRLLPSLEHLPDSEQKLPECFVKVYSNLIFGTVFFLFSMFRPKNL